MNHAAAGSIKLIADVQAANVRSRKKIVAMIAPPGIWPKRERQRLKHEPWTGVGRETVREHDREYDERREQSYRSIGSDDGNRCSNDGYITRQISPVSHHSAHPDAEREERVAERFHHPIASQFLETGLKQKNHAFGEAALHYAVGEQHE